MSSRRGMRVLSPGYPSVSDQYPTGIVLLQVAKRAPQTRPQHEKDPPGMQAPVTAKAQMPLDHERLPQAHPLPRARAARKQEEFRMARLRASISRLSGNHEEPGSSVITPSVIWIIFSRSPSANTGIIDIPYPLYKQSVVFLSLFV